VVRREEMGFKAIPWMPYYKPSLDEFVIRQRHTHHISERVKKVNEIIRNKKPAIAAHNAGVKKAYHIVGRYVVDENGNVKYVEHKAVPIKVFKEELRVQMLDALSSKNYKERIKPERAVAQA